MSENKVEGRDAVKKFFNMRLDSHEIKKDPIPFVNILVAAIVGSGVGWLQFDEILMVVILGLLLTSTYLSLNRILASKKYGRLLNERKQQEDEFVRLSRETRNTQAQDNIKAFLRVFERTQIDRESLRILDQNYVFEKERDLFDQETLEEKLGDLSNKSIRFISSSNDKQTQLRRIYWQDKKRSEWFFNPMRQIAIFISDTQFVICDVNIDSAKGNLSEEIQRISLDTIVSIHFKADRKRTELSKNEAIRFAEEVGFDSKDIETLREKWKNIEDNDDCGWVNEVMTSNMAITRTDGISLSVPIGTEFYFGEHLSALDQDSGSLTEDEIKTDRLTNELNRMVIAAK